jgi:hypothetical protein
LFRAALLAGYGRHAIGLARRLASAIDASGGRSCLDAGAALQITVDAPGPPGLRVGLRLGEHPSREALSRLVPAPELEHLLACLAAVPRAAHPSLGTWLFWTESRRSLFVDLRDPSPEAALARLRRTLDARQLERLVALRPALDRVRPWVLRVEADETGLARTHVHWLLDRHQPPERLAEALAPGSWPSVVRAFAPLLRNPRGAGRWVVATPLDDLSDPALRIGSSGWAIVTEDDRKHRALGEAMRALGGPRDYAEALWSLCRGTASPGWRVGRACELRIGADGSLRARFFLTPYA